MFVWKLKFWREPYTEYSFSHFYVLVSRSLVAANEQTSQFAFAKFKFEFAQCLASALLPNNRSLFFLLSPPRTAMALPPMKLAIVGAGPSAFYVASRILSRIKAPHPQASTLRIHMYDRLWAPHGLVRYGVAPDHPEVKVTLYILESEN